MEYVTTETPVTVAGITLIPVVRVGLYSHDSEMGGGLAGNKEPLAIILCDQQGVHAWDINSSDIAMSLLLEKIPGLNTILAAYQSH
ncbi:MAG: hypothetical protein OEY61_11075 [Gammaproteobacteria bacterium]|nr:hypothetical protein [Gammaproteobacteria bacterium]